jgi:hypothetical protein
MITIILAVTFLAAVGLVAVLGLAIRTARNLAAPKAPVLARAGAAD